MLFGYAARELWTTLFELGLAKCRTTAVRQALQPCHCPDAAIVQLLQRQLLQLQRPSQDHVERQATAAARLASLPVLGNDTHLHATAERQLLVNCMAGVALQLHHSVLVCKIRLAYCAPFGYSIKKIYLYSQ